MQAARAFLAAGLEHGERIAIWAPNMWQWIVAAIGAQSIGGVLVPLNTRLKGTEAGFILRRSSARWLFTVADFLGMRYPAMLRDESLPDLKGTVLFEGEADGADAWDAFLARGNSVDVQAVEARASQLGPDDTLDILFT
ncbi:MAG: AMP-binding protein, partial [Haliea sp.]|nr:AMP-binding protein [Haliea sp.]